MVDSAEPYLGISQTLMYKLVDLYFETAYNASLLLHKASFLEALTAGTATPHVVLSICAWAAKYMSLHSPLCYSVDNLHTASTVTKMDCLH